MIPTFIRIRQLNSDVLVNIESIDVIHCDPNHRSEKWNIHQNRPSNSPISNEGNQ